jgi:hypothetical protein
MRHRAKIDWMVGLGVLAGLVVPGTAASIAGGTPWGYAASGVVAALVFGFCFPQWYETTTDELVIRAGLTTRRIPYSTIVGLRPSSDRRSSFALSLDRVEIEYGLKKVLIAPRNQEEFFADIAARAPQLVREGVNLVIPFASLA